MRGFGSDNHAGVHPLILKSIQDCNNGHTPSYGTDELTQKVKKDFQNLFNKELEMFFVFNGTAANSLCVQAACRSFESVLCSEVSHLNVDECGAPEFFAGCKLIPISHKNGKVSLNDLKKKIIRRGDQHYSQVKMVSLTQPTELGTCYTVKEIKEITNWAHSEGLYVHIDGARIANAVAHLNSSFAEMIGETNIDLMSFGGTKNGLLFGEAILFFNKKLANNFLYLRKQAAQLPSKTRFLAAQFQAYLNNSLWLEIAGHSLKKAQQLREVIAEFSDIRITQPTESNAVFAQIPKQWIGSLRDVSFFYVWDQHSFECRLMTAWDTQDEDILKFKMRLKEISK